MKQRKEFFDERTEAQIAGLKCTKVGSARELVKRIMGLDPREESLRLDFLLTPQEYGAISRNASRRNFRRGQYLALNQPYSIDSARKSDDIPLQLRQEAFESLGRIPEEGNFCLGYSFRPIVGTDRTRISVPFWSILEGCRIDSYVRQVCDSMPKEFNAGYEIKAYDNNPQTASEGAVVFVRVPSRTGKGGKYKIRWEHIAVKDNENKRVVAWGAVPKFEDKMPLHKMYNFGFSPESMLGGNGLSIAYPHDVASHSALIRHYMKEHNFTPLEMSQYALASKEAVDFYKKLKNNILIDDSRLKSKSKLRKLHLDEVCMLQARQVGVLGAERTMYWDAERDGRIKDYDWGI